MKIAIVVLVVLVVFFVATFALIGNGVTIGGAGAPPTKSDGSVDQDRLSDWHPPSIATLLAKWGDPLAPHADFGVKNVTVDPLNPRLISAARSNNDVDIAKIQIVGDGAVLITYSCTHAKDGSSCSQTVCLCKPGSPLTSLKTAFCGDDSQWKQSAAAGVCSSAERVSASLLIYPESRQVLLTGLGPSTVAIGLR
jgi:hypothetical protein